MTIMAETIAAIASIITSLVVIFGAVFAIYRWYLKQEKQDKAPQPAPVPVQTPDTAVSGTGLASFLERPTWSKKKLEL